MSLVSSKTERSRGRLPARRMAFTLVELLLVIAIISILVALLLPAVQQAREAARRTQCKNNLAQYCLALHNYQHSFTMLPPGVVNTTGPISNSESGYHMSWQVQLLPWLDQYPLYQQLDFDFGAYAPENNLVRTTSFPTAWCPSSPPFITPPVFPISAYAGCTGGSDVPTDTDNDGLLFLNSSTADPEIRDGASNTLLVGERRRGDIPIQPDPGWMSGTAATLRNTGIPINQIEAFWDLEVAAVPPAADAPPPGLTTGGFSSHHTGGSQFALADGSVRFLSENITFSLYQNLGRRDDGQLYEEF